MRFEASTKDISPNVTSSHFMVEWKIHEMKRMNRNQFISIVIRR